MFDPKQFWTKSKSSSVAVSYSDLRHQMVQTQLEPRGIHDRRVLDAMGAVPREEFVPADLREAAYDDGALPILCGQTISQPFTVAFMYQALSLEGRESVLENGTGSGYGAAVLSLLARVVYTVERIPMLGEQAAVRLDQLGYNNVHVRIANGTLGWKEEAPFDAIVVTAGAERLPPTYADQLSEGGRIVIPLGAEPHNQMMYCFTLRHGKLQSQELGYFAFVPLIGKHGWSETEDDEHREIGW